MWPKILEGLRDKEKRRLWQLGGLLVLGLLLMGASGWLAGFSPGSAPNTPAAADNANLSEAKLSAETELEGRLAAVLSRIRGAGEVSVSVTFARSAQAEYAVNASTTVRSTEETTAGGQQRTTSEQTSSGSLVLADGNGEPVLVQQSMAEVQGVLVVAQGGGDPAVRAQIAEALQNLLAVPAHKIVICEAE